MNYASTDETIIAISSASGHGLRGIVRLSGPEALPIARRIFVADETPLMQARGFSLVNGVAILEAHARLPATAYVFRAPRSYTRQDTVELHTVGAPPVLEMLVERCVEAGARPAEPGEFTARAFLAGAMTLPQAEAVAATIRAASDDQLRAARRMMTGDLFARTQTWAEELADLLALVVADIDFSEEPIDFITPEKLARRLAVLQEGVSGLLAGAADSERLDVLPHVLLLGLPNAGKSTLFNRLTGMDRAIASAVSGTTRDILVEPARVGDLEVMLLDAAGIDDDTDEIIAHSRQRALEAASTVDLVVLVVDISAATAPETIRELTNHTASPIIVAANKADLLAKERIKPRLRPLSAEVDAPVVLVSGVTGVGLDDLRAAMRDGLTSRPGCADESALVLTARQRIALVEAKAALDRCADVVGDAAQVLDIAELVAFELREALDALANLTGAVTTEDLLGRIFGSFCIGK